jgi:uncharacterized protein YbcI
MTDNLETQAERQIGEELLALHRAAYGKGAGKVRVHILDDLVILILDELELMPNEEFLIGEGEGEAVIQVRSRYQQAIEGPFRAAVERGTGRRVISFASNTKLDPNYAIELFRLGPKEQFAPEDPAGD